MTHNLLEEDIQLDFVRLHYNPKGILELHYEQDVEISMTEVRELMLYGDALFQQIKKKYGVLSVLQIGVSVTEEVRKYATSEEANKNNYATAVVLNSLAHRIIANFIARIQKPIIPHKHFSTFEEAESWLLQKQNGSN